MKIYDDFVTQIHQFYFKANSEEDPLQLPSDMEIYCFQAEGVYGGGQLCIEGRLSPQAEFTTLRNCQGESLKTARLGIEHVGIFCPYIRLRLEGGDETTDVEITLLLRRSGK